MAALRTSVNLPSPARRGHVEEELHLRPVQVARQILVEFRRRHRPRGIRLDVLVAVEILEKAAHCAQRARDRALVELLLGEISEKTADGETVEALPRPGVRAVIASEVFDELLEIA
jgi:hypothetical protein